MVWKVLVTAAVFVVIWATLFRTARPRRVERPESPRRVPMQDFVKCKGCGIYLPPGQPCDCADRA